MAYDLLLFHFLKIPIMRFRRSRGRRGRSRSRGRRGRSRFSRTYTVPRGGIRL